MSRAIIIALCALVIVVGVGELGRYLQDPMPPEQKKMQYELQEKCAKDAEDFLDRVKAGKVVGGLLGGLGIGEKQDIKQIQNHYSARFNKCFVSIDDTVTWELNGKGGDDREEVSLWNVNDNNKIGDFVLVSNGELDHWRTAWCWVKKPDYSGSGRDSDRCFDPSHIDGFSENKWTALIRPYMQDSE